MSLQLVTFSVNLLTQLRILSIGKSSIIMDPLTCERVSEMSKYPAKDTEFLSDDNFEGVFMIHRTKARSSVRGVGVPRLREK